jgi:asparagine synthase (glutamine-hydrolysing)
MTDQFTLIFNGEIYNYLELRQDLVRDGVRFRTHSDTEVLLRCYERFGEKMLEKLNVYVCIRLARR